ncbi:MAG: ornithine cyclodeaminase family protein [Armatimonadota bacterium]|nr:ornithine cyclodeaminase family protein [Armatimonadota bacterium]MDW8156831.1 ornithine cyclodeaminase family protein [Armatimonadota bacterium]
MGGLRVVSAADLDHLVSMRDAIEAVREAFRLLSRGRARVPLRVHVETPAGVALWMPAAVEGMGLGVKAVTVFAGNPGRGLPTIQAAVLLQDPETGTPLGVVEGASLTALRTGAATGLATELLARKDAGVVALFGCGAQARRQLEAVCAVRPVTQVRVYCPTPSHRESFAVWARQQPWLQGASVFAAPSPEAAVRGAEVVVTATPSHQPVFSASDLGPGTHVNAIGSFTPQMREIPPEVVAKARVVVDSVEAARREAGDLIQAAAEGAFHWDRAVELGPLVEDPSLGRRSPDEVTLFKSVGVAVQDVAVGMLALRRAAEHGAGVEVPWT